MPTFKAKLAGLRAEDGQLRAELAAIAKNNAQAALLADIRQRIVRESDGTVDLDQAAEEYRVHRAAITERFHGLALTDRRALVRAYVEVTVHHGRRRGKETQIETARRRSEITHKITKSLNPLLID